MTPTERARRVESLYHDNVNRRALCEMIANRESDLEAERAKADYWRRMYEETMAKEVES